MRDGRTWWVVRATLRPPAYARTPRHASHHMCVRTVAYMYIESTEDWVCRLCRFVVDQTMDGAGGVGDWWTRSQANTHVTSIVARLRLMFCILNSKPLKYIAESIWNVNSTYNHWFERAKALGEFKLQVKYKFKKPVFARVLRYEQSNRARMQARTPHTERHELYGGGGPYVYIYFTQARICTYTHSHIRVASFILSALWNAHFDDSICAHDVYFYVCSLRWLMDGYVYILVLLCTGRGNTQHIQSYKNYSFIEKHTHKHIVLCVPLCAVGRSHTYIHSATRV